MNSDDAQLSKYALLTGATGALGRFLLPDLLRNQLPVAVLVRATKNASAEDRIETQLSDFEQAAGISLPRPIVLPGDLNQSGLGLSAKQRDWIASQCGRVLHSAANLSFRPAAAHQNHEPFRTNVEGTRNLLAVCEQTGITEFHYVSTAYVCGVRSDVVLEEERSDRAPHFANDYERSKAQAEHLLRNTTEIESLTIYRPSIVVDPSPNSGSETDQAISTAFSMFHMLAKRFGLPKPGEWLGNLGLTGNECKNIVRADWVSRIIVQILKRCDLHGGTYHLTSEHGTEIRSLEEGFRQAVVATASASPSEQRREVEKSTSTGLLHKLAEPYVATFMPYFRDDPKFDRTQLNAALQACDELPCDEVTATDIASLAKAQIQQTEKQKLQSQHPAASVKTNGRAHDPIVVVGMACRVPGCQTTADFDSLLFSGRSAIGEMPPDRFDRELYFDKRKGRAGKTYATLGGCAPGLSADNDASLVPLELRAQFDTAHLQFCDVAAAAWRAAGLRIGNATWKNTGVYVGHSGGTEFGGKLGLATQIEEALDFLRDVPAFGDLPAAQQQRTISNVAARLRRSRPFRTPGKGPHHNAYLAASLAANSLQFSGPRHVVDGACASSLVALNHATMALQADRIDAAIVGGATYNGVDNLILFSHSQACSESGSRPFDNDASGLISAEGYVAVVITTLSRALRHRLPIEAVITGLGVSTDGRGRSLWAPRQEGQELALRRAYSGRDPLDIDYLEAHATSTQLGDATELKSVSTVAADGNRNTSHPLLMGSVKSNIGHTLESAGLIGMVKVLLAMRRGTLPPSINVQNLNSTFDWANNPIKIVTDNVAWKRRGSKRRAGISAFGIGGLNAHVHLEEYVAEVGAGQTGQAAYDNRISVDEPIAIVGRGVVLPGALDLAAFEELLTSGRSAISEPPNSRWRGAVGQTETDQPTAFTSPTARGGYITDFQFDGQKYRIPPKQVQQANPVQMMLLDAVTQAVAEYDSGEWSFDRQRTGVVIGTIFGEEFGNQLQIGLRLPEICRQITAELQADGVEVSGDAIASAFRETVLKNRPALLDETGSFTASTLSSRVAKTFDLMGGACAIDADDASGLAALSIAVDQLRAGQCDTIVCGTAHRAMDLSAFEELDMAGRLVRSGRTEDVPDDCSQVLPGEGVVALLLCRLSDALASDAPILGVIQDVTTSTESTSSAEPIFDKSDARLVRQIGYLSGSQPLVRLVSETLEWQRYSSGLPSPRICLKSRASDGFTVSASIMAPGKTPAQLRDKPRSNKIVHQAPLRAAVESEGLLTPSSTDLSVPPYPRPQNSKHKMIRLGAATSDQLLAALNSAIAQPQTLLRGNRTAFRADQRFRVCLVDGPTDRLAQRLHEVREKWQQGNRRSIVEAQQAVLWEDTGTPSRIAWLFPGQGSQYAATPSVFEFDSAARACLQRIDEALDSMGLPHISPQLDDSSNRLGIDVWLTQLWILSVGCSLAESFSAAGGRPDFVLGHSFGEYVASVTAGVLTLEQAVHFAKHRSDAVLMNVRQRGVLLSVKGSLAETDALLRQSRLPLTITHYNSPTQTVVAGLEDDIHSFRKLLSDAKFASIVIPVPAPFHTSMLADAERVMTQSVSGEVLRPPSCGFLSATSAQFLAEPDAIRNSLLTQLTQPVLYQPSVQRLLDAGCDLLVEIGPNDVLTRLNREIVGNKAVCLSLDVPGQSFADRLRLVDAVLDCVGSAGAPSAGTVQNDRSTAPQPIASNVATRAEQVNRMVADDVEIVDVTSRRRSRSVAETTSTSKRTTTQRDQPVSSAGSYASASMNGRTGRLTNQPTTSATAKPESHAEADAAVSDFLTNLVVELTGYAPDVVDMQADLEADLGLDSIKVAQIVGELAEWASLNIEARDMRLGDIRTLSDIAALSAERTGPSAENTSNSISVGRAESVSPALGDAIRQEPDTYGSVSPSRSSAGSDNSAGQIESMLVDFVIDQTGYSRDVVDLDADLEADLGLDSIKIAQIVGELQEQFSLQTIRAESLSLGDFRTLRSIQQFLTSSMQVEEVSPAAVCETSQQPDQRINVASVAAAPLAGQAAPTIAEPASNKRRESPDNWLPPDDGGRRSGPEKSAGEDAHKPLPKRVPHAGATHRFALRVAPAPRRDNMPTVPTLNGPSLIIGNSRLARSMVKSIRRMGHDSYLLDGIDDIQTAEERLKKIWQQGITPHLFLLTSHDSDAMTQLDARRWKRRRVQALQIPFRICQLWMQAVIDAGLMENATVIAASRLGGDFGFDRGNVQSPESLTGLVKAMLIECWMRGFRTTPMKVVDIEANTKPDAAISGILNELAVPSYDMEVVVAGSERLAVKAIPKPLQRDRNGKGSPGNSITRGGTWIVTGGGRGITAMTSMALAEKYDLRLHLLGTAAVPSISESMRSAALSDRSQLRRDVMASAAPGENSVELWRNTEKAIEIDITLQECQRRGIQATYHSCDVANTDAVAATLENIRAADGEIRGVLHGAGAGQDSRFDRKRSDKVEKCLKAKIDGALGMMDATRHDPLEWFVAYGSISGRFGANGHTDYSLANDMMAKLVDRYRSERPEVTSLTFHWHAWGDVGMATKPEARLALEMIDMEFMPATEGVQHFLDEFEFGGDEAEVLITDHNYHRKFFPADRLTEAASADGICELPMLNPGHSHKHSKSAASVVTLDPVHDRFLSQHRIQGTPTLPFVVALEIMAEAARLRHGTAAVIECRDVVAVQALKFPSDTAMAVTALAEPSNQDWAKCSLQADVRRRDGRLVEQDRTFFHGEFRVASEVAATRKSLPNVARHKWERIEYLDADAAIYHGPELQCLRKIAVKKHGGLGLIAASAPVQLFGAKRTAGWTVPCAAMDACLYAVAVLGWKKWNRASLPVRFGAITFGRQPDPGEPCIVQAKFLNDTATGAVCRFRLQGLNGDVLLNVADYEIAWLR